jgi:hypothetical protein
MKLLTCFGILTPRRAASATLFALGATWLVIRFCGLGVSPPGFFMDEAAPAVHAMCLAETGKDADGKAWPLYSSAAGGGHHPLTLMAFDIPWMKVFGTSREAFRAVSAFWILLTAFGLFFVAREVSALMPPEPADGTGNSARRAFPWMVLLAALLSPWGFQFSRVGWESPLAPAYMILAVLGLLRCRRGGNCAIAWSVFAGFCAAASMTSYPPLRAAVPLVCVLAGGLLVAVTLEWRAQWTFIKQLLAAGLVAAACFAPTARMLMDSKINDRMNNVAIWNERWMRENAGDLSRWHFLIKAFFDNLALHLRPSFLFIDGDASLRHNPHLTGQLSPLDMLALALVVWTGIFFVARLVRGRSPLPGVPGQILSPSSRWLVAIAMIALLFGLMGLAASALTFDAIPHAMRAIGAWPFVALFTGAVLALGWTHRRWMPPVLTVVAVVYTAYFLPAYFHAYDKAVNHWFMREMTDVLAKESHENPPKTAANTISEHLFYSYSYDEVPRYYLMTEAHMKCEEAAEALRSYKTGVRAK